MHQRPPPAAPAVRTMTTPADPDSGAQHRQLQEALSLLEHVWENEQRVVDSRAARRSTGKPSRVGQTAKACVGCRKVKARCLTPAGRVDCERCSGAGLVCEYPSERRRGPKKQLSKNQELILRIQTAIQAAISGGATDSVADSAGEVDELSVLLRNPLATLAAAAHQSSATPPQASSSRELAAGPAVSYYDSGVYQPRPEADFSVDPVLCGILTHSDLERLVHLYFVHLHPFFWHLDPAIHHAEFLRLNSPFLTSAICAAVASFDPSSARFAATIHQHAHHLAIKAFAEGQKSIEVVQAYVLLAHWAQPEASWNEDRAWTWQGEAMRIATEIRLDLPIDVGALRSYRTMGDPFSEADLERFQRSQSITWSLLFAGQIAMSVQTGRMDAMTGLSQPGGLKGTPPFCAPDAPDYQYQANDHINRIFARALNLWAGLRNERATSRLHRSFVSFWKPELQAWSERWTAINPFMQILAENFGIVLNLISLQFAGGSVHAILSECRAAAIRTLNKAAGWQAQDQRTMLSYASNFVIVNIAYGAVLLLQLSHYFDRGLAPGLQASCLNVADILDRIGRDRVNGRSIATLHAERIKARIKALAPPSPPLPLLAPSAVPPVADHDPTTDPRLQVNQVPTQPINLLPDMGAGASWTADEGAAWGAGFSSEALDALSSMMSDPMLGGWSWGDAAGLEGQGFVYE
ncbi:uncharacterized protein JCM15063_000043 [Sporobolomyces koalae]|uniref:uncharacterized protein n=1 Tax=Sporobolomyces koalae TaxID=500713 RepID=UPI003172DE75